MALLASTTTLPSSALILRPGGSSCAAATSVRLAAFPRGIPTTVVPRGRGAGEAELGLGRGTSRGRKVTNGRGLSMLLKYKMRKRRNSSGDFFVDESCLDCDICCWMDPRTYKRAGLGAVVTSQPKSKEERMKAFQAMLMCPAGSIRVMRPDRQVIEALDSFPLAVDDKRLPGVEGEYHDRRPQYMTKTADKVAALGDVKYMIVTARENADGHEAWKKRFPDMIRILHRHDLARKTRIMEERLDGAGPWYLVEDGYESPEAGYVTGDTARFDFVEVPDEECAPYDPTVKIVGLPGQTRGSIGVIVERGKRGGKGVKERLGFSGGTVGLSSSKGELDTYTRTIETNKKTLAYSVRSLAKERITWLMPGRGARVMFKTAKEGRLALEKAANKTAAVPDLSGNSMLFGSTLL
eukprot:g16306.t1